MFRNDYNEIEALAIVPTTTSLRKVYASHAIFPAEERGGLGERSISASSLNTVHTITNSRQYFHTPSRVLDKSSLLQSKEEVLAFFACRIYALLFGSILQNHGNVSSQIIEGTTYEGPIFNLEPRNKTRGLLLPDVAGHWGIQQARYPLGITQDDIDLLIEHVRRGGHIAPLLLEEYFCAIKAGSDPFAATDNLAAATINRLSGYLGNVTNDAVIHQADPKI